MPNALYDKGREGFADKDIGWVVDNIKAVLVDAADYAVDLANDQFLSDILAAARVATSANLVSKTKVAGVCDAADVTFSAVVGDQSEAIVLYQDTGVEGASRLIAYIDTASGLPVTPNGGDIQIQWDNGAYKIFKL